MQNKWHECVKYCNRQGERECLFTPPSTNKLSLPSLWQEEQTAGAGESRRRYLRLEKSVRRSFACQAEGERGDLGELECVEPLQQVRRGDRNKE